ncbi:MAG: BMC domain-containing protein [Clostridiales bacterium]|jgi:microcompartment protein CcmL/EutN|nr:BMC domain-containing protein [Clostridiales bacterium]
MAYGFFEVQGVVAAIDALDIMTKTARVSLATWERKLGGRLVTVIIEGNVAAVTEAIAAATASCLRKPAATAVLANPHEETVRLVKLSASRMATAVAKKEK